MADRGAFIDFDIVMPSALGVELRQRFRLFPGAVTRHDLAQLKDEAAAVGRVPVAVAPRGGGDGGDEPTIAAIIGPDEFDRLCRESGVVFHDANDRPAVDRSMLQELRDYSNSRFALLSGLLWLRPLSRNRRPPALCWTGKPAHELFEASFFQVMSTIFRAHGTSWGTRKRGRPVPDGVLMLPDVSAPVLYDCKAAQDGYSMQYRDLTGFADYLKNPIEQAWACPDGVAPRFLVISSEIRAGSREASFAGRQRALRRMVPGATLTWMRARDLVRFGLALEQAEVRPEHRETIAWTALLDTGDVTWTAFRGELERLAALNYTFAGLN